MNYLPRRLLVGLWNKIKRNSSVLALSISEDDIVIFVVGPTGSGKSWFIKEATKGQFVRSSREYHPSTRSVQAIRCELTDEAKIDLQTEGVKNIVFIDTPSFLTGCDDIDARNEIKTWIDRAEHKHPRYLGMIYMHRIETDPALEPIQNHLREFSLAVIPRLSRNDSSHPLRLHIVVSYDTESGTISPCKITKHERRLREQVDALNEPWWRLSMHREKFQGRPEVAWAAVEELLGTDTVVPEPTTTSTGNN